LEAVSTVSGALALALADPLDWLWQQAERMASRDLEERLLEDRVSELSEIGKQRRDDGSSYSQHNTIP